MKLTHPEIVNLLLEALVETEFQLKMHHAIKGCYLKVPDVDNEFGKLLQVEYIFNDFYDDEIVSEVRLSVNYGRNKRYRKIKLDANDIISKVKELI